MACTVDQPLLHDGMIVHVVIDGAGVGMPIARLCPVHSEAQVRPCHTLRKHPIPIAGVNCRIPIPVEHNRWDDPGTCPRRGEAAVPRLCGGQSSVLHRGECGGEVMGDAVGETRMDADGGIEIGELITMTAAIAPPADRPTTYTRCASTW